MSSEFAIRSSTAQPSSRYALQHSLATDDFKLDAQLLLIKKEFLQETETEPQFFEQPFFCCSLQLFFPSFSSEYSRLPEALKYWKEEKTFGQIYRSVNYFYFPERHLQRHRSHQLAHDREVVGSNLSKPPKIFREILPRITARNSAICTKYVFLFLPSTSYISRSLMSIRIYRLQLP